VHYTDATLRKMIEKAGFEVQAITIGKPIQVPIWHEHVGHYYLYPTPFTFDVKRQLGRLGFYWLAFVERVLRLGAIGWFAPNIVVVARRRA
jgi:hypothetical protein